MSDQESKKIESTIFSGKILNTTIKMSIPIFISQLVVFINVFCDTIFVAGVDKSSTVFVTAIGLVYPLITVFFNLCQSNLVGVSSVSSRLIGEKDDESLKKVCGSSIVMSVVMSLLMGILAFLLSKAAINLLAGSEINQETIHYANEYFTYLIPGLCVNLILYSLYGILQGEGNMGIFGLLVMLSAVINIILDPIFIYGFDMGVKGAAIATSLASIIPFVILLFIFIKKRKDAVIKLSFKKANISGKLIGNILKIGLVTSIGMFVLTFASMLINKVIGSVSEEALNAWVLVGRMDQLFLIPAFSIGLATVPMIGQNFGRKNGKRCNDIARVNLLTCLVVCLVVGAIYMLFAPQLFGLFTDVSSVTSIAVRLVRLLTITSVAVAGTTVVGSALQGIGKPVPGLVADLVRALIFASLMVLQMVFLVDVKLNIILIFIAIGNVLSFVVALVFQRYYFRKIKTIN